uniref:Uncharacterized protein n=1 Tax=Curvibacter symbiont subsp. Hydra magnipapillata TaxID=667019 RepID=C9Y6R1_CURXX|nr:hypothetical protein Csp_E36380 [Curvibacter putative symbiont of Hydra magnipapillata]
MVNVRMTSQLTLKLQGSQLTPNLLITRFKEWKLGGEYGSYWFGQTKTENDLTHTHMAPVTPGETKDKWDYFWSQRQPHRRRSDCYVLYAYEKNHGYLLIDVIFDPGAHDLWKPEAKQQLLNYEIVADNFVFAGTVP